MLDGISFTHNVLFGVSGALWGSLFDVLLSRMHARNVEAENERLMRESVALLKTEFKAINNQMGYLNGILTIMTMTISMLNLPLIIGFEILKPFFR